jgi:propanol-preferring alcohol dehydrogenase
LHTVDGRFDHLIKRPVTLGHEVSGIVDALGPLAFGLEAGEPVVVMAGWGCGSCEWCRSGREQICPDADEAGATRDGGLAEFMLVPHPRYLVPLNGIDPALATPFGCAAVTALAAVTRVMPHLRIGSTVAVLGTGGLGTYAVHYTARHYTARLSPARVLAVDHRRSALDGALRAGAHEGVVAGPDVLTSIRAATADRGCDAVLDFVGSDESLALAAGLVARRGVVALLGLAGGRLAFDFETLAPEATLTTVVAGSVADLHEVVRLASSELPPVPQVAFALEDVQLALDELRAGRIEGRAVVVPSLVRA